MEGDGAQDLKPGEEEEGEALPGKKLVRLGEPGEARNKAKQVMEAIAREVERNQDAPGMIAAGGLNEAKAYVKATVAEAREPAGGEAGARVRVLDPRHAETVKLDPKRIVELSKEARTKGEEPEGGEAKEGRRRSVDFLWILIAVVVGAGLVGAALYVGGRGRPRVQVALPLAIPVPVLVAAPSEPAASAEAPVQEVGSPAGSAPAVSVNVRAPKPARPGLGEEIFQ